MPAAAEHTIDTCRKGHGNQLAWLLICYQQKRVACSSQHQHNIDTCGRGHGNQLTWILICY